MLSIKKFLSQDAETERTRMHVLRVLVQGIGQHAVEGDTEESEQFRLSMACIADALTDDIAPEDLLLQTGSVVKALEEHTRRTTKQLRLLTQELQNMLKMLTSAIGVVSSVSEANVGRLSDIGKQVASVSELGDVRMIKSRLSDCLKDIRDEAERQRRETGETIEQLNRHLTDARRAAGGPEDELTGLPVRSEAEMALAQAGRSGDKAYAAILVLDRLQSLNMRFGREVGDSVLVEFVRMLKTQLTPRDRLFRWSGTALLALLPRPNSLECVRSELGRVMDTKLEHTVQTPSRSILLPIAARWAVFPMMAAPRLIYQKLDAFATVPGSRD